MPPPCRATSRSITTSTSTAINLTGQQLIDTGALLALANQRDQDHRRAVGHARHHLERGRRWVGTTLVLAELHGLLVSRAGPERARSVVRDLLEDSAYTWLDVSVELVHDAIERWLARYADQSLTLTDAVSFEVMRRTKISEAFAYDRHFGVAGFETVG